MVLSPPSSISQCPFLPQCQCTLLAHQPYPKKPLGTYVATFWFYFFRTQFIVDLDLFAIADDRLVLDDDTADDCSLLCNTPFGSI